MEAEPKVNILLVDDQPGKLLSYQVILEELGENLITASSAREALEVLLKNEVAVLLVDVCMPDLDGFELASMVREHPRFQRTAIIFISAIHLSDVDSLRGYEMGAVDYVPVPIVPALLRAKVRVFVDLYRKTKALERWNAELEERVDARTEELREATRRQELLAREVDHRAKNVLAIVQSIVHLTRAPDIKSYSEAVHGRIRAMANAHALLAASRWAGASLGRLVDEELSPYLATARIEIAGPQIMLEHSAAQAVAMALHELATNAAKYGALSHTEGFLSVSWKIEDKAIVIAWIERGGAGVEKPKKSGFGSKLIASSVGVQLGGAVDFDWRNEGLSCTLTIPISALVADARAVAPPPRDVSAVAADVPHVNLRDVRVLVVEDEAVVSLMIGDLLRGEGAKIVGAVNTLDGAVNFDQPYDIAVLDVNLKGVMTYPLAERLKRQRRPFVFATGYDEVNLDERFHDVEVLQKPFEPRALIQAVKNALSA